jgi:hypothetical protein
VDRFCSNNKCRCSRQESSVKYCDRPEVPDDQLLGISSLTFRTHPPNISTRYLLPPTGRRPPVRNAKQLLMFGFLPSGNSHRGKTSEMGLSLFVSRALYPFLLLSSHSRSSCDRVARCQRFCIFHLAEDGLLS